MELINSDCLLAMQKMPSESVDVVITSPPYNVKKGYSNPRKSYSTYEDNLPFADYLIWLGTIFVEIKRILKPQGSFFLNIGGTCKEPCVKMDVCQEARKYFTLQNDIVWVKSITVKDKTYGNFQPVISDRFLNHQHESIFHFTKDGKVKLDRLAIGVQYSDKQNVDRWNGKIDKKCRGNVWFLPYKATKSKTKAHPATFPIELPECCIKLHGFSSDLVVLDPFMGIGTTLFACEKLGCSGIGIEIDQNYYNLAVENLK